MRAPVTLGLAVLSALLSACATTLDPSLSYVQPVPQRDSTQLAEQIASYMAQTYPPANSTVVLVPPQADQATNPLTPALKAALLKDGFGVADPTTAAASAYHRLAYDVTPLDAGALVRLRIDGTTVSRFYSWDDKGALVATAPFAVMRN